MPEAYPHVILENFSTKVFIIQYDSWALLSLYILSFIGNGLFLSSLIHQTILVNFGLSVSLVHIFIQILSGKIVVPKLFFKFSKQVA